MRDEAAETAGTASTVLHSAAEREQPENNISVGSGKDRWTKNSDMSSYSSYLYSNFISLQMTQ